MTILGFDTSCACAKAAVYSDGRLLAESYSNDMRTHSVKMLPMIDECIKKARLTPDDIDLIGVINGPGSFTGLRIGVATAKAVAYAKNIPVVGINTLEFLASASFKENAVICPVLDARSERVYCDAYFNGESLLGTDVRTIDEIAELSENIAKERKADSVIFTGDAVLKYGEKLTFAELNDGTEDTAKTICLLAEKYADRAESAVGLKVNYFRKAQAERLKNA